MLIKKIAIVFLCVFALVFAFHQSLLQWSLQLYLAHAIDKAGFTLAYDQVQAKPNRLTFSAPQLFLGENKGTIKADSVSIAYSFHPFEKAIDFEVDLSAPEIELFSCSETLEHIVSQISPSLSWFTTHLHIKSQEGTLKIFQQEEEHVFQFKVDHCSRLHAKKEFILSSNGSNLEFSLGEPKGYLRASEFQLEKLNPVFHTLFPSLNEWAISSGILNGTLNFSTEDHLLKNVNGALGVHDLVLQHKKSQIKAKIKDVVMEACPCDSESIASVVFTGGLLAFADDDLYGMMRGIKGKVFLDKNFHLKLQSDGIWSASGEDSQSSLEASINLKTLKEAFLEVRLNHLDLDYKPSLVHIAAENSLDDNPSLKLNFINVREREFAFAQRVMDTINPVISPIRYLSGTLNASLTLNFSQGKLSAVSIHEMDAYNCFLLIKPWELALGADYIAGNFSFDLQSESLQETLNAALKIQNGKLVLTGINADLWDFTHIETVLEIQKGIVQASSASVQLAGLKGKAEILSNKTKEILQFSFSGKAKDLKPFVPERIQNGIHLTLDEDEVQLTAQIHRRGKNLIVKAVVDAKNLTSEGQQFHFGFIIDSSSEFKIKDGWFNADGLVLDKFIDPFLFPDRELQLSGFVNLKGTFDGSEIQVHYGGRDIQIKNENLTIEIPLIENHEGWNAYNFITDQTSGYMPLKNATYFDKNTGLFFTDIHSKAYIQGKKIHFTELESFSNGLYFSGDSSIDYSSEEKGSYSIHIHANAVEGSFSAAQHFFEHFDEPFFFTKIPLDGVVGAGPKGVDLFLDIRADDYDIFTTLDGSFSEGKMICPNADLSFQELSWSFFYDQKENRLEFNDIQGMLLLGKPEKIDEYSLHSENILFTNFANNSASFDVSIKDALNDFIRIKGETRPQNPDNPATVQVHFDLAHTHFGTIFPNQLELTFTDWNRIDQMQMSTTFTLNQLLGDLNRFGSSEVFGITKKHLEELENNQNPSGDFTLSLGFVGFKSAFEFNLYGKNVTAFGYAFDDVTLNGYNRDDRWVIEQLQLDQLGIAAEVTKHDEDLKVDFLGVRFGKSLLIGLEGAYRLGDPSISAKVNLFELDLGALKELPQLESISGLAHLQGKIKGSGDLTFNKLEQGGASLETTLNTYLKDVHFEGASLSEGSQVKFHFLSDEGFSLTSFKTDVVLDSNPGKLALNFKELGYDFIHDTLKMTGLNVAIDANLLPWAAQALNTYIPRTFDKKLARQIGELKKIGTLKAALDLQASSVEKNFHLIFEDGTYNIFGEERHLKNFTFDSQQDELKVSALYHLHQKPIWLSAKLDPRQLTQGSVLLADAAAEAFQHPALVLDWRIDPEFGVIIQKASGYLAGLNINLKESHGHASDSYALRLTGDVDVNGREVRALLSSDLRDAVDTLKIGSGYKLKGEFEFGKGKSQDIRFFGMLTGQDLELKGFQFDKLSAQVILEPTSCQLLNCTLSDLAGTFHMGNLRIDRMKEGVWKLNIPLLTANEMRPSLLQPAFQERPERKPLVIRQINLQNITGILGDSNSFKADGQLYFINPQKKHVQNALFAIPSEILTRIGLDLSVLTPVSGMIQFDLKNGHFVLKKFKDVFSEGKISKFYLPSSGVPSTIDLDGNMNIQVRFKQSTLLLKLAEMFTITVKGHILEPKYSLQRQKYLKQEEVFSSELELVTEKG